MDLCIKNNAKFPEGNRPGTRNKIDISEHYTPLKIRRFTTSLIGQEYEIKPDECYTIPNIDDIDLKSESDNESSSDENPPFLSQVNKKQSAKRTTFQSFSTF